MRKVININDSWSFLKNDNSQAKGKEYDDSEWENICIPHIWNAIDGSNGMNFHQGACWYRKYVEIDPDFNGNRIFIEFNGANSITELYVNGQYVGQHKGGYSIFRFDITDFVECGAMNTFAVKVDNTVVDDVYPQKADFTFYGGIYRNVNLIVTSNIHFDLLDYGSQGVYITQEEVNKDKAKLKIKTLIRNEESKEQKVRIWVEILDDQDNIVACMPEEIVIDAEETIISSLDLRIDHPILWHGRENPYLYKAKVSIIKFNDTIDELIIPFGVRYVEVDSKEGFFLNGEKYNLYGVARHQDKKDKGWAISELDQEEDMELIKEIGATSIRLAHYQHDQYFYELCDREGMVVWAEIPFITKMSNEELDGKNAKQQLIELIRQNYNHPSVVFWGTHNEIQIGGERPEVRKVVKELDAIVREEDPTRLTTMANVSFVEDRDEYNYIPDVLGINKYFGWYHGEPEDFGPWLDHYHEVNPQVKLCVSEYGAEGIVEYHSDDPKKNDYSEEYHALYHEKIWSIFKQKSFLWATYVWNMFDFGANIRDEGGVQGRNNKGLITYDRKIKKDAFYLYKAHWSQEKFVHITSKRFIERSTDKISIKVYSNCDEIFLLVNGDEIQCKNKDDKTFIFEDVVLKSGTNEVQAFGKYKGDTFSDIAIFKKVSEPNAYYLPPEENVGDDVQNWFTPPDLSDVIIEEIEIPDGVYSKRCTYQELLENEETKAILTKYMGDVIEHPMFSMVLNMTMEVVASMNSEPENDKLIYMINKELIKIKKD